MFPRPQLVVLAVLAAAGAAFGGYFLWPSARHVQSCEPQHAPVPAAAQEALAAYADRIRYSVDRSDDGTRNDSWSDPETGRMRQVSFDRSDRITGEVARIPNGRSERIVWVLNTAQVWFSDEQPAFHRTAQNEAAREAQAMRDKVAAGKAVILARGNATVHLREVLRLPKPQAPAGTPIPKALLHQRKLRIDTWVDPLTYLPIRIRTEVGGRSSVSVTRWLPRTAATLAKTRLMIPKGFKHETQRMRGVQYTDLVKVACAQS